MGCLGGTMPQRPNEKSYIGEESEVLQGTEKKRGISDPFYQEWCTSGFAIFSGDI